MNTVELKDAARTDRELARECILRGVGALGRGRRPFASARIIGNTEKSEVSGSASFYYTPLGLLVCASVKGLEGARGVYTLSICSGGGSRNAYHGAIPPLYARNGYAWCSALTEKITPYEVLGRRITLCELGKERIIGAGIIDVCGEWADAN